jgi:hypothetical protein
MPLPTPHPISEEQAQFERVVIRGMLQSLESVQAAGYSDWQTLTRSAWVPQ